YGQRAVCIILSGTDSDGVIGLKHIKAQGGVTIAQEPTEAEHDSMPRHAIETGMVDWVLPVRSMAPRLLDYLKNEKALTLPPEQNGDRPAMPDLAPSGGGGRLMAQETHHPDDENALHQVLSFLRTQTGHDFAHYKRATVLRRIARRLQVNSLETLPAYLEFLQTHPGETNALLSDLLINVTHFFRDPAVFAAFEANIPQLFTNKGPNDQLRVWVPACATGEEAYSIAILLCEQASRMEKPPAIQVFATDLDEDAVRQAREGIYPTTIEADVSAERLRHYFFEHHGRYRIKKEVRELVLFAAHDLLRDSPFSHLDLVSCRNLLIYLKPEAQHRALDIFHFALNAGGLLLLGSAESVDGEHTLFAALDKRHRLYVRRNAPRQAMVQLLSRTGPRRAAADTVLQRFMVPPPLPPEVTELVAAEPIPVPLSGLQQRLRSLGEMHVRLIEEYGPPSVVVDENYDIVHMSRRAGDYLRFAAGEPSANLLRLVDDALRLELRTALFRAWQTGEHIAVKRVRTQRDDVLHLVDIEVWPARPEREGLSGFLVMFDERPAEEADRAEAGAPEEHEPVTRHLEAELRETRTQLNSTVEHYETTNEELKAANEELQAVNEETRSATEELETSKEELQSVNEELTTVNQELKSNVDEIHRTNNDLQNLIASTDLATIFLDTELRIRRYTPRARDLFKLILSDLGRPLSDITGKLDYPQLADDAARVLGTLEKSQREISFLPGSEDTQTFLARLSPYRTVDDKISGVVITFINITERVQAEKALRQVEEQFHRAID
ncbi:MAG: PAS domain-containing protein, partial [Verrucomicrobiota bacterium]|nr:PAS domain-containing protein [Verrucomicrobiota bacterium]